MMLAFSKKEHSPLRCTVECRLQRFIKLGGALSGTLPAKYNWHKEWQGIISTLSNIEGPDSSDLIGKRNQCRRMEGKGAGRPAWQE